MDALAHKEPARARFAKSVRAPARSFEKAIIWQLTHHKKGVPWQQLRDTAVPKTESSEPEWPEMIRYTDIGPGCVR